MGGLMSFFKVVLGFKATIEMKVTEKHANKTYLVPDFPFSLRWLGFESEKATEASQAFTRLSIELERYSE